MNNKRLGFCEGKKKYNTKFEAESTGAMQELIHWVKLRTYKCPNCNKWHLTKREAKGILSNETI
jgi:hypothetical protein